MIAPSSMVGRLLCSGCVCGGDPADCTAYRPEEIVPGCWICAGHVLGTFVLPSPGHFALGMPRGFNRPGINPDRARTPNKMTIRLWPQGHHPVWDHFNIAVWAMRGEATGDKNYAGYLFVRTAIPRRGEMVVDVVEGGGLDLVPGAVNVGDFYEEID